MIERNPITESTNPHSEGIDTKSTLEICRIMNQEDQGVALAVSKALPQIAAMVDDIVTSFRAGGRLIYIGAGTSGRLGVLDASECPPTFGVSPSMVVGLIAGGDIALRNAVENAEDDGPAGIQALKDIGFSSKDSLVGITASGGAAFVVEAMRYAKSLGSHVGAISCNPGSKTFQYADHPMLVEVGPEIITGSTRLKSGTAQKMVLNMLTTVAMIKIGLVYNHFMVNLKATNKKLEIRAKNLIMRIAGVDEKEAAQVWAESGKVVNVAILLAMYDISSDKARRILEESRENLHVAMAKLEEECCTIKQKT